MTRPQQQPRPSFDFGDLSPAPDTTLPATARKGRGAVSNHAGRFEPGGRPLEDDGWLLQAEEGELPPLRTTVSVDTSKSIISRNDSPDLPFNQSINAYRGCEHGCIYCFARPTHAYLGLSPGLDFESRLYYKPNAAKLLEKELRRPSYKPQLIALGTNTDPYQPIERRYRVTRSILQVMSDFQHPVGITTKSANVLRDLGVGASGSGVALPLLGFNLGVEIGQVIVAAIALPLLWRLRRHSAFERFGVPILSGLVAAVGLYWLLERTVLGGA